MITTFALACFCFSGLCGILRLLIGPDLADRIMALDVVVMSLMGAIAVEAARTKDATYLVSLAVLAIIGFTATTAASAFIALKQRQGGETI
ncbi:MAG: hypothetical protein HKN03_01695 [Acidimicrobiales bacterium]|nr:hypothetical protein [Acidimicrobiales bacterium]